MTEDGWCIWRGCWNDEAFTSAENDNTMAMGKTNMGSLKNRKKTPQNLTRNPLLFHIFREPESYILLFFSIYPLNPIFGTYRLLIDYNPHYSQIKDQNPVLPPRIHGLDKYFGSESRSMGHGVWQALVDLLRMQGNTWGTTGPCQGWARGKACGRKAVSVTHVGVFGSRLWKCYRQRQTLPLDATSQATKPPSHVQRGSHCFCQPEPLTGNSPSMEVTGSKSGIRVFSTGFSLWGSNFKNMEKERFGATFCSIPHW